MAIFGSGRFAFRALISVVAYLAFAPAAAASVTSEVQGSILVVTVDSFFFEEDSVYVTCDGGQVKVNFADPSLGLAASCSTISLVVITVVGGAARVDLSGVALADFTSLAGTVFNGGAERDTVVPSPFPDDLDGGGAGDTGDELRYYFDTAGVTVDLAAGIGSGGLAEGDTYSGFESVIGGSGNDVMVGDDAANFFLAWGGSDTLRGGGGDDYLMGGDGADELDGGSGVDVVTYANATGGVEVNLATGAGSGAQAQGDTIVGVENVDGSGYDDVLIGNATANRFQGFPGADTIDGGDGDDLIVPGAGADTLTGGPGSDTLDYSGEFGGPISVDLSTQTVSGGNEAQGDIITGFENALGGQGNDQITGDDGPNVLSGGTGEDVISALGGEDEIRAAEFNGQVDDVDCGDGVDIVVADPSVDVLTNCEGVVAAVIDVGGGAFNDGAGTTGAIAAVDPDLIVLVEDAPAADGVRVTVSGSGAGKVTLFLCGFSTLKLGAGGEVIVTCGSVTVEVVAGAAEVALAGGNILVAVPVGATATISDNGDGTFTIENDPGSTAGVAVTVGGVTTTIGAGESGATVAIDIMPGSASNPINRAKNGAIPVAILGSATFDVTSIDVRTLTFAGASEMHNLQDPTTYAAHLSDINKDGFIDLVSHYRTKGTTIERGDAQACLRAETLGGAELVGCDVVSPK